MEWWSTLFKYSSDLIFKGERWTNKQIYLRTFEFPGEPGHDVDSISSAHSDAQTTKTAAVGSVRVRPDHQQTRKRVVLQNDLNEKKILQLAK